MAKTPPFAGLARDPGATLDVLALALAAEFRDVEAADAMRTLDILGAELSHAAEQTNGTPEAHALACGQIIGAAHGFVGDQEHYDDPGNSMLDLVLRQRRGLPILLSVVYVEVARRAGIQIAGVGLPGHFVVGHFGTDPPVLLDPFAGGGRLHTYDRRGDVGAAIHAAELRLALPAEASHRDILQAQLRAMQARLN
jgi:regulator of sirC expression with transglutaminase-like and TPR domain